MHLRAVASQSPEVARLGRAGAPRLAYSAGATGPQLRLIVRPRLALVQFHRPQAGRRHALHDRGPSTRGEIGTQIIVTPPTQECTGERQSDVRAGETLRRVGKRGVSTRQHSAIAAQSDAPAHEAAGEHADHERDMHEAHPGGDVREIGDPLLDSAGRPRTADGRDPAASRRHPPVRLCASCAPETSPHRPSRRFGRSIVQRATGMPSPRSCRQTLRAPYTRKFSSQTRWVEPLSSPSRCTRGGSHEGSTPCSVRCASINAIISSGGGRAPPRQKALTPCAESHWRASAPGSPIPAA